MVQVILNIYVYTCYPEVGHFMLWLILSRIQTLILHWHVLYWRVCLCVLVFSVVLIISAAMLCPVLLCATLLLLSPQEIAEARALHPSPDAVQVKVETGREVGRRENKEWIAKDSVHKGMGTSNEMYPWLNYTSSSAPCQLNCLVSFPVLVYGAGSGTLQWPFDSGRPGGPAEQPTRAVHPQLSGQSRGVPPTGRRANAVRHPLVAAAEGGRSGQSEASWTGPVEEGVEPRVLRSETGPNRVYERSGLLEARKWGLASFWEWIEDKQTCDGVYMCARAA